MRIKFIQKFIDKLRGKTYPKLNIVGNKPNCLQKVVLCGKGVFECSKNVQFGYFPSPDFNSTSSYVEARETTAKIFIDENTTINNHSIIICNSTNITIGKNCLIGINFQVVDSDFHHINYENINNKILEEQTRCLNILHNILFNNYSNNDNAKENKILNKKYLDKRDKSITYKYRILNINNIPKLINLLKCHLMIKISKNKKKEHYLYKKNMIKLTLQD